METVLIILCALLAAVWIFLIATAGKRFEAYLEPLDANKYMLKAGYKKKEQFPNEQSLERYVATVYTEYNSQYMNLKHHGFGSVEAELLDRFV